MPHGLLVGGLVEEQPDDSGDPGADAVDLGDLLGGGVRDLLIDEVVSARRRAARSPTKRILSVEDPGQAPGARAGDRVDEVRRRFLGEALELGDLRHGEPVEVREVADQPALHHLLDHRFAEVLDVHGARDPK